MFLEANAWTKPENPFPRLTHNDKADGSIGAISVETGGLESMFRDKRSAP